jgi:hypothetical protein|tara:strand:- start:4278 stop:4580 length:303 start_codon:yes stop_codon:yes gene_type:complete
VAATPDPVAVEKKMALTHADFFRIIPRVLGTDNFEKKPDGVILEDGEKRLEITLGPERERRIANLRVPATDVRLEFSGYTDSERAAQLDLFERMFQKGGG